MSSEPTQPSEEELRAAWEEQLRTLTPADVIVQAVISLVNLAGRRLGLDPGTEPERDLAQARDGIDGARALLPIIERHESPQTLASLREALSALQLEYAKLAGVPSGPVGAGGAPPPATPPTPAAGEGGGPGPAQSSGRLWVPGS